MPPDPPAPERAFTLHRPDGAVLAYGVAPAANTTSTGASSGEASTALVLLHGVASNMSRWSEFVERSRLRGRQPLIRLDLRGHGESRASGAIGLEVWADDLAALLDHEGHGQAILVGHSLGAQLALHFAHRHPRRAAALVLIDPVFREALRRRWRWLAVCSPVLRMGACGVRGLNALGLRRRRLEVLDLRQLDMLARRALASPQAEAAFVRRYSSARADLRHTHTATYLQDLAEMFRALPDAARLRLPVLALLSTGATFAEPGVMRTMLARLPQATVTTIACHHWPLTERPDEVRTIIEHWCDGLGQPAARADAAATADANPR